MSATPPEETGPVVNTTRARQGALGKPVLLVLILSTLAAAVALFAAWGMRSPQLASTEVNNGRTAADARAFNAPEPAAKTTDDMKAPGMSAAESSAPITQSSQAK